MRISSFFLDKWWDEPFHETHGLSWGGMDKSREHCTVYPYQSEFTKFIQQYLQNHPEVDEQRRELFRTWWEKKTDSFSELEFRFSRLPQKPYVYYQGD